MTESFQKVATGVAISQARGCKSRAAGGADRQKLRPIKFQPIGVADMQQITLPEYSFRYLRA